jgi:hypothetical protein
MREHVAIEYANGTRRECRVCGRLVVGVGPDLRHLGESVAVVVPEPGDRKAVSAALVLAEREAERLGREATPEAIARAVVQGLYQRGWLRRRRGDRKGQPDPVEIPERYEVPEPALV